MTEAMSMVKFSSHVFRVLNEKKNDWENEKKKKNGWGKCLGLPHTGYGPTCLLRSIGDPLTDQQ